MRLFVFILIFALSGLNSALAQPVRGFWYFGGGVQNILLQPNGKVMIGGTGSVNGSSVPCFARLNIDGDRDQLFRPFQTAAPAVSEDFSRPEGSNFTLTRCAEFALQPDGKVVVVTNGSASYSSAIRRLNPDGTVDSTFSPPLFADPDGYTVQFHAIALAPDGKVYVGGNFQTVNGILRRNLVRLNQDGTLDLTFGPVYTYVPGEPQDHVTSLVVLPDEKIIVGGYFDAIGGTYRTAIARLNPNGTADSSFINPGVTPMSIVKRVFRQLDGKLLLNGSITVGPQGTFGAELVRLNADGSWDSSFRPPAGRYRCVDDVSTTGKLLCILGADFDQGAVAERPAVIRLNNIDGSVDQSYVTPRVTGRTQDIAIQPDGKLIVGGDFALTQPPKLRSIIRFNPDGTLDAPKIARFDYDGDLIADISVFRPSIGKWYILGSLSGYRTMNWGEAGDKIVPADFDGDAIADMAVYRPSNGMWYIFNSATNTFTVNQYGLSDDIPMPGLFDPDRKADLMLFRPSTGRWYLKGSTGHLPYATQFGQAGDIPLSGDFDGDLFPDLAVYRPSDREWKIRNQQYRQWGEPTDKFVPADYDGDGRSDIAVYRPSTGDWWIIPSSAPTTFSRLTWGIPGDVPVVADYDGDGKADRAVFRPSNNSWYIVGSSAGIRVVPFGASGDIPTESVLP